MSKWFTFFFFAVLCLIFFFTSVFAQKTKLDRSSPPEMGNGTRAPPSDKSTWSSGFGTWKPMYPATECSAELHNKYWVRAPDGKIYHTWHPTSAIENGKTCYFGHEHGEDPASSNSFKYEPIPFGYLNEVLGGTRRHEDHVGHKVGVFNDAVGIDFKGQLAQKCDTLMKIHMGTHSNDAFVNSVHEVFIFANCDDGRYIKVKVLQNFGPFGEFRSTDTCHVNYGVKVDTSLYPKDHLQHDITEPAEYMASRGVPYKECVQEHILQPPGVPSELERFSEEHWRLLIHFDWNNIKFELNPYLHVFDPIRYYDGDNKNTNPKASPPLYIGYFVDLCYLKGNKKVNAPQCDLVRNHTTPVKWNSRYSPFLGAQRAFEPNALAPVMNSNTQTTFWTDVYLRNPSFTRPGPNEKGRIEQVVKGNVRSAFNLNYAKTRVDHRARGLHAPN